MIHYDLTPYTDAELAERWEYLVLHELIREAELELVTMLSKEES